MSLNANACLKDACLTPTQAQLWPHRAKITSLLPYLSQPSSPPPLSEYERERQHLLRELKRSLKGAELPERFGKVEGLTNGEIRGDIIPYLYAIRLRFKGQMPTGREKTTKRERQFYRWLTLRFNRSNIDEAGVDLALMDFAKEPAGQQPL